MHVSRNSPGSSSVQQHQLSGCLTPRVCTNAQYQTLSPVSEPPAPFSLSPSTGKAGWTGGHGLQPAKPTNPSKSLLSAQGNPVYVLEQVISRLMLYRHLEFLCSLCCLTKNQGRIKICNILGLELTRQFKSGEKKKTQTQQICQIL